MIPSKTYVGEDSQGMLRVGSLGVSLDSVVIAFRQGQSAETIQQLDPALSSEEVYGAVAFYPANRDEVHQYLTSSGKTNSGINCASAPTRIPARWCSGSAHSARSRAGRRHEPASLLGRQRPE